MSGWDTKRPVSITKFEILCILRQYSIELGKPEVGEQRVKDLITRLVELRTEFAKS